MWSASKIKNRGRVAAGSRSPRMVSADARARLSSFRPGIGPPVCRRAFLQPPCGAAAEKHCASLPPWQTVPVPRAAAYPSPEYLQHFRVDRPRVDAREFRTGWRIKTHVFALAEGGFIGRAELEAGLTWRAWSETLGRQRTQSWAIRVDRKNSADMTEHELAAAGKLKAAAQALGPDRTGLLHMLIIDDCRWRQISALIGVGDERTTKNLCAEALSALALWLVGRPVPDPPRRWRYRRAGSRERAAPGRPQASVCVPVNGGGHLARWGPRARYHLPAFRTGERCRYVSARWRGTGAGEFVEQHLGVLQVLGVESLGKPAVDGREQIVPILHVPLVAPQALVADSAAQLPGFRLLRSRPVERSDVGALRPSAAQARLPRWSENAPRSPQRSCHAIPGGAV
jgi:hypothetical protein